LILLGLYGFGLKPPFLLKLIELVFLPEGSLEFEVLYLPLE
jgi:hypothetical protein